MLKCTQACLILTLGDGSFLICPLNGQNVYLLLPTNGARGGGGPRKPVLVLLSPSPGTTVISLQSSFFLSPCLEPNAAGQRSNNRKLMSNSKIRAELVARTAASALWGPKNVGFKELLLLLSCIWCQLLIIQLLKCFFLTHFDSAWPSWLHLKCFRLVSVAFCATVLKTTNYVTIRQHLVTWVLSEVDGVAAT